MTVNLVIEEFARKQFLVKSVPVTDENVEAVAEWCHGEVRLEEFKQGKTKRYIKVNVHRPLNERQTKAYVGDRVLSAGNGFKVYSARAFENSFELVELDCDGKTVVAEKFVCEDPGCPSHAQLDGVGKDKIIQSAKTQVLFEDGSHWEGDQTSELSLNNVDSA